MAYLDVRDPFSNKLLFRYDPQRELVEYKKRNLVVVVDLAELKRRLAQQEPPPPPPTRHE